MLLAASLLVRPQIKPSPIAIEVTHLIWPKAVVAMVRNFKFLGIFIAIGCLLGPAALAQQYHVSGVWLAEDNHTPGSKGGACFTLKLLGIDSIMDGSLPTVLIFSDGKRIEARSGYLSEESIRSVKSTTIDTFRIAELPTKRSRWFPWSTKQSHSLKIVDPLTIEFGDAKRGTRFVKCSSKNSLL